MQNKIQVINLERSLERRNEFIKINAGLNYEFVSGVDGKLLSEGEIKNNQNFIPPLPFPSLGAYGAALSHLQLWELAISNNTALTIAEDDAIFRADFHSKSLEVINQLPADWDIVLWGWNFDSILSITAMPDISPSVVLFNQDALRNNVGLFRDVKSQPYPFRLDKCFGIPAYTISPKGASVFKSMCFPMKNFELFFPVLNRKIPNTGIDVAMNKIYATANSYVSFPPLVVTKNEHASSTIQQSSD
jgi:GR25 family glycosyltransferase involved in LPS biosynthesis